MAQPKLTLFLDVISPFAYIAFYVTKVSRLFIGLKLVLIVEKSPFAALSVVSNGDALQNSLACHWSLLEPNLSAMLSFNDVYNKSMTED